MILICLGVSLMLKTIVYFIFSTHMTVLRYTSYKDIYRLFIAISLSSFLFYFINNIVKSMLLGFGVKNFVILFDYFIVLTLTIGYRVFIRYLINQSVRNSKNLITKKIAIIGTDYQSILIKHFLDYESEVYKYEVDAYFTNDQKLIGKKIENQPIFHINELKSYLNIQKIDTIVVSKYKEYQYFIESIIDYCDKNNIDIVNNENLKKWITSKKNIPATPIFHIEELLQRTPIQLDIKNISLQLKNKKILVTGAAGSIGSELCRQILKFNPSELIIIDQAESAIYDLENEIKAKYKNNIFTYIADITNRIRIHNIFENHKPEIVFHAAAYKHVPLMEQHPFEAINTNIIGTKNVADFASKYNSEKFVFISTDKAVNPTNVMGASKRAAEIYIQSLNNFEDNNTKFITTRFGNVLGSNGSVIPLFKKQIESGGPVYVTHPEITRFFMTIPEACQLVLEAGALGSGSEIYIFDMGKPVKIIDLAKNLIKLYGLKDGIDIKIEYSGLRPGEKLYEELLADKESTLPTHNKKIMIAKVNEYSFIIVTSFISKIEDFIVNNGKTTDLVLELKNLIPEYISNNSEYEKLDTKV